MSPIVATVLGLSLVAVAIGTPQVPRIWRDSSGPTRLLWMGVAFYNLTFIIAGVETLRSVLPPGVRWYLALLPTIWLLIAVLYWPVTTLMHRSKEPTVTAPVLPRPEPVLNAAKTAAAVSALIVAAGAVLVLLGITTQDEVANWASITGLIVTAIAPFINTAYSLWQARKARALVTPLSDPQFADVPGDHAASEENQ